MQNSIRPAGALLPPDLEPDEVWKEALKMAIGVQLRSVVDEARKKPSDELAERANGPKERQRLTAEHLRALQTIRQPGEGQFYPTPGRELQERLWTCGAQTEHARPRGMMKEKTTILERAKRVRKNKAPVMSLQSDAPRPPPLPSSPSSPHPPPQYKLESDRTSEGSTTTALASVRKVEHGPRMPYQMTNPKWDVGPHLSHPVSYKRVEYPTSSHGSPSFQSIRSVHSGPIAPMGSWKAPSVSDMEKSILEFSKSSPMFDELKPMPRSPIPATPPNPTCREGIQRKPSIATGSIVQEFWKPSITREEDMQMLRTSRPVRQRNTATSSVKSPFTPSVVSTDSLDALSTDVNRELMKIPYTDHEWIGSDRAQEKDGERKRPVHGHAVGHLVQNSDQRLRDHGGLLRTSTTPPSSATYPRSKNDSDVYPIAQRLWKPSVTHENMHISRTFRFATRDGSAGATTSSSTFRITFADALNERPVNRYTDDRLVHDGNQRLKDRFGSSPLSASSPNLAMYPWPGNSFHLDAAEVRLKKGEARLQEDDRRSRELEIRRREEVEKREKEVNSREMMIREKEKYALQKEEEAQRRMEEATLKAQETQRKEEELRRREDELNRRKDLGNREAEMRWDPVRLREEHWKREEETSHQSAEEGEKQGVLGNSPLETLQPIPSPQMPNSSGPLPIPNEHGASAAVNPPTNQVGVSAASGTDPTSSWLSTSARPTPTTSIQPPNTPKSSGPAIPASDPPTSLIANTPLTKVEFHRQQAEQAWQREDQSRREKVRLAMQECERQANAGGVRSREKVMKLFEAHHNQWDKIQTFRTLIWEDFPWPMFKSPKGPEDLTSHAISDYMLSSIHPQDRVTKGRIKDNIRRWHLDQFSSMLPRVEESERERVLEGARSVARILNNLLRSQFAMRK